MLSRGESLLVLAWVLVGVSSIVVALRFLARLIRIGRLEADDWFMLLALVSVHEIANLLLFDALTR